MAPTHRIRWETVSSVEEVILPETGSVTLKTPTIRRLSITGTERKLFD